MSFRDFLRDSFHVSMMDTRLFCYSSGALYARNLLANTFSLFRVYMLSCPIRSLLRFQETRCARIQITGYDSLGKVMTRKWIENGDLSTEIRYEKNL